MAKLPIPDSPETLAYRAVCRVFRGDPKLKTLGMKFRDWQDNAKDVQPVAAEEMPCLEIAPSVAMQGWWSVQEQKEEIDVALTLYLAGTNADDVLNCLGLIRGAMWPSDPARRAVVEEILGPVCTNGKMQAGAFTVVTPKEGTRFMTAECAVRLTLLVNT